MERWSMKPKWAETGRPARRPGSATNQCGSPRTHRSGRSFDKTSSQNAWGIRYMSTPPQNSPEGISRAVRIPARSFCHRAGKGRL